MDKEQELYQEEQLQNLKEINKQLSTSAIIPIPQMPEKMKAEIVNKVTAEIINKIEVDSEPFEALSDSFQAQLEKATNLIVKAVLDTANEPVSEITVKNIEQAQTKDVNVTNLSELQKSIADLSKVIIDNQPVLNVEKQTIQLPYSANKPLAVRLSDGKSFYNAITTAVSNGMASFIDQDNKGVPVRLKPNGSVPVSIEKDLTDPQTDVFNQLIIGTRNNQLEVDFSGTDPDTISLLTVTKTNGGDASNGGGQATFQTGTNTSGEIRAVTNRTVTYHPHAENYAAFSAIFSAGLANSFQRIGLYSDTNGFFVGYEGTSFGVTKRSNSVDETTAQSSFNVDTLTGQTGSKYTRNGTPEALDTTKDNLYRIRYGWLGAAPIYWEVLSPDGEWVTFHIIKHPNTATVPTIEEPNQPLRVHVKKTSAGATNLTIKTACWAAGTSSDLQKLTQTLYDDTLAKTVRSVIAGQTTGGGGGYVNVKVNPSGALTVEADVTNSVLPDNASTATLQELIANLNDAMLLFIEMIYANQARLDTAGRQTVNIETGTLPAVTTVTTLTTLTTLTNAINFTTAGAPTTIQNSQLLDPPAHIYNAFTL